MPANGTDVDRSDGARGRVLVVSPQPFYQDRGTPIAVRYVATALGELGHPVDLLAFPVGEDVEMRGVRVLRSGNPLRLNGVPIGLSWPKIALDVSLFRALRRQIRTGGYRWIHAVEEAAYMMALGVDRGGAALVVDMASSIPEQLERSVGRGPIRAALSRLERRVLANADHVVCSAGLADRVRRAAVMTPVSEWRFPTPTAGRGDDRGGAPPDPERVLTIRRELGLDADAWILLYTGNMARYQGVESLLDAVPALLDRLPEAALVLVGATQDDEARLGNRVADSARHRVRIQRRVARGEIASWMQIADVLVLPRAHGSNLALKAFDYLSSGKPILATDCLLHRRTLGGPGVAYFDGSSESFAEAAMDIRRRTGEWNPVGATPTWNEFRDLVDSIYGRARAWAAERNHWRNDDGVVRPPASRSGPVRSVSGGAPRRAETGRRASHATRGRGSA